MNVLEVPIVQAFVDGEHGGNLAGVVLNAERLTHSAKQAIAAQIGLSETAFISPSSHADFLLEFFTPVRQIAHCGHATIATFSYLAQQGMLPMQQQACETIDGMFNVFLRDTMVFMQQRAPRYTSLDTEDPPITTLEVLEALELSVNALMEGYKPVVVNTGNNCLIVPVYSATELQTLKPDFNAISEISEQLDLVLFYVFAPETTVKGRHAGTRMFAPRYGIPEESATGMAAGPLGCYLHDFMGLKHTTFAIEQGYYMNPPAPSVLQVELILEDDAIQQVLVGGKGLTSHTVNVEYAA